MSTRCTIHFHARKGDDPIAIIYRHCDGYPDGEAGVPASLTRFFEVVREQTNDTRFTDPSYLAAKYVVWQAGEYAFHYNFTTGKKESANPLDFLSLGVVQRDPGDIAYRYHVYCSYDAVKENGVPVIRWEPA